MTKIIDKMRDNPAIKVSKTKIYVYEAPNNKDTEGYLKIGRTDGESESRIKGHTRTAMVKTTLLKEFEAVDDNGQPFTDSEIHQFLRKCGIENKKHFETGRASEWFKISLEDIEKVIYNRKHFIDDFEHLKQKPINLELYPSQQNALDKTYDRWKIAKSVGDSGIINKFLWNAKPRFGKTITAYEFIKKTDIKNALVMTQRTSISNAWFSDYNDYVRNSSSYQFGSSKDNKIEDDQSIYAQALSPAESKKIASDPDKKLIYYTTLANIKGKDENGFKQKNRWIYDAHWDLVILDETHEGTETINMDYVLNELNYDFLLELSGTPFRKMSEAKGYNEKNTYSWSYSDEQEAKEKWDYSKGKNPYINLPKINIYTFQIPSSIRSSYGDLSEYSFEFSELFKVHADNFVYEQEVDNFLDILSNQNKRHDDPQTQYYPFADVNTREQLRHTFWKLPSTDAVRLVAKKLREHPFFSKYTVIEAAGSKYGQNSMKAEKEVKAAIGSNGLETLTITLSYDMLTTGTTVKEWTAVLMLDNGQSASKYIQTAFRAQTPWSEKLPDGKYFTKTDAYVFDFNPDRVLKVIEEYANIDTQTSVEIIEGSESDRNKKTQMLLNFLPVVAMDKNGKMRYLDAKDALDIRNYTKVCSVVDEGFMSNNLFNVKALFNMHGDSYNRMRDIVSTLHSVPATKKIDKNPEKLSAQNPEEEYNLEKSKIISQSGLGEKKFAAIESADSESIGDIDVTIEQTKQPTVDKDITSSDLEKYDQVKKQLQEAEKKQKAEEDKFRDRLRGFARTIPVLLMAYGKPGMKLNDFDRYISSKNFYQVTGITKDDFDFIRKARAESGELVINEELFNMSIREFLRRKEAAEHYYNGDTVDDIYNYIPSQENNRVFTSRKVVNKMLDILEQENPGIFKSTRVKILDPYVKSGNFLAEAAKRFYKYSKDKDIKRIIENQLFGLAPFEVYATLAQETVYSFADSSFKDRLRNRNIVPMLGIEEIMKDSYGLKNIIKERFGEDMKFDVVIGNPPYQEEVKGRSEQPPLYHHFMDNAYKTADKVCFITPARFLFNAGKTPKYWNEKMLDDKHLKVAFFEQKSERVFPGTDIKGGVAITYRDKNQNFGKIGTFTHYDELNSIMKKVSPKSENSLSDIYYSNSSYKYSSLFFSENPGFESRVSGGSRRHMTSSVFDKFPEVFMEKPQNDNYVKIIGRKNNKRVSLFFDIRYIKSPENFHKFKVLLPGSNGSGAIGEVLSTPLVGEPLVGHTETFISFGAFDTREEAENLLKYVKTKFARTMLGVRKVTQGNKTPYVWGLVPLQNFTASSDIDWSKSIPEIDRQLYKKYGLDEKEIAFIEEKVRKME